MTRALSTSKGRKSNCKTPSSTASIKADKDTSPFNPLNKFSINNKNKQAVHLNELAWIKDLERECWRRGTIVSFNRPTIKPGSSSSAHVAKSTEDSAAHEAYVHWIGSDRRLDTWVPLSFVRRIDDPPTAKGEVVCWDEEALDAHGAHEGIDEQYLKEHEEATKLKTIQKIKIGKHLVSTWYFSPFPPEVQNSDVVYICHFCLQHMKHEFEYKIHRQRCLARHPPGNEIYSKDNIAVWEVDGGISRIYSENLCFISKLFLDHKTLLHPVYLFLFYILTEKTPEGYEIVGYFSKEKYSHNNVSCILTLPQHQRKGYGTMLVNFSYALSRKEKTRGTPERPLSDLGLASYLNYWAQVLLPILRDRNMKTVTVEQLSNATGLEFPDVVMTLEKTNLLHYDKVSKEPIIVYPESVAEELQLSRGSISHPIDPEQIRWLPYDIYMSTFEYNPNP